MKTLQRNLVISLFPCKYNWTPITMQRALVQSLDLLLLPSLQHSLCGRALLHQHAIHMYYWFGLEQNRTVNYTWTTLYIMLIIDQWLNYDNCWLYFHFQMTLSSPFFDHFFRDVPLGRHIETGKCQGNVFLEPGASSRPQTLIINMLTLNPFWIHFFGWGGVGGSGRCVG